MLLMMTMEERTCVNFFAFSVVDTVISLSVQTVFLQVFPKTTTKKVDE